MRRGLISWSKDELPEAVLDARVAALQAAMAEAGLDAVIVYTTPARAAAVAWLAAFVPYWNQGLLVVTRTGQPILVSALSNRVNDWMRRNAHVADVRNAPRIGAEAGMHVATTIAHGAVGVVDLAHLPAAVIDDIAGEGHRLSDATALFAALRAVADAADIALHEKAAGIVERALASIEPGERDAARLVARIDGEARRLGAEEVYLAVAADLTRSSRLVRLEGSAALGEFAAVRIALAYKGAWVRVSRTLARDAAIKARIASSGRAFGRIVAALPNTDALSRCEPWLVEGTRTALPLEPLAGSMIAAPEPLVSGSIVSVQATVDVEGMPVLIGGPALIGTPTRMLATTA